jgi:hypothetical protein
LISSDIAVLQETLKEAQLYRPGTLDKTRRRLMQAFNLKGLLNAIYENYEKGPSGKDIPTNIQTPEQLDAYLESTVDLPPSSFDMSKYYQRTGG